MATYAIGDIQGCHREFVELLTHIGFRPPDDHLWLTGDLVNRGPQSLAVLREVMGLGRHVVTVLGNHDLHLLAHALGNRRRPHRSDTFGDILAAADYAKLLDWLRHQPLLHRDIALDFTMVHAGLPPQWDIEQATNCARELEVVLRGPDCVAFFDRMYGNEPDRWDTDLTGWDRLRFVVNCLTRMRYCTRRGRLDLKPKGPPGTQDDKLLPWYEVPDRRSRGERIIFGHWATLHLASPEPGAHNVWGLDTGCVWGGRLTAMRLEDLRLFSVASHTRAGPGD